MAIDPIGLTIGLVGLFAASLDVLDRISTAKAYGKDYQLFVTKVETERFRLWRWGQAVGLARGDGVSVQQHELLQDPRIEEKVCELLTLAIQLFEDSDAIGMKGERGRVTFLSRRQATPVIPVASNNSRGRAGIQMRSTSAMSTSTMKRVKWAISGQRKSEKLLQDLIYFVDKLHELVPTSGTNSVRISQELPETANNALSARRQSRTMQLRIENRKLESRVRRAKKNTRRIAMGTDKKLHKIRVDERNRAQRQVGYFWWYAGMGSASRSLVFF
ncbi:hypothetical protein K440DRAFT_609910 [Wilcoxina mikolae CBS 423.85]|nr:hypothetical protein K440DRAFT_609910 [Wilcoxina mikolae CBS 423.85]